MVYLYLVVLATIALIGLGASWIVDSACWIAKRLGISVGDIVGSIIFNRGFILGSCALVRAIPIGNSLLLRDGTVLGGA